ncbi:MAG: MoaD/ThiS family protein [Chloroflexi bacterium]|nr:MoaD/ThiS family protein [Chloroflexota bacterium]
MAVTVKLFPTLQNLSKSKLETLELDWHEGLTAKEILEDEGFNERDQEAVLAVINDAQSQLDTPIADGDAVELRINMQGG